MANNASPEVYGLVCTKVVLLFFGSRSFCVCLVLLLCRGCPPQYSLVIGRVVVAVVGLLLLLNVCCCSWLAGWCDYAWHKKTTRPHRRRLTDRARGIFLSNFFVLRKTQKMTTLTEDIWSQSLVCRRWNPVEDYLLGAGWRWCLSDSVTV